MGAKASTNNGNQSPRTFSNSSSSDVVSSNNPTSFNFLRAIHGVEVANDSRQRARRSVPDMETSHRHTNAYSNNSGPVDVNGFQNSGAGVGPHFDISQAHIDDDGNQDENNSMMQGINALGLGRVYTASMPSHIWSINGNYISAQSCFWSDLWSTNCGELFFIFIIVHYCIIF